MERKAEERPLIIFCTVYVAVLFRIRLWRFSIFHLLLGLWLESLISVWVSRNSREVSILQRIADISASGACENKKDALLRRRPSKSHFGNSSDVHRSISFDFWQWCLIFWRTSSVDIESKDVKKKDIESTDVSQYVPLCKCHVRETARVGCADGDNFHPSKKGLSQRSGNSAAQWQVEYCC